MPSRRAFLATAGALAAAGIPGAAVSHPAPAAAQGTPGTHAGHLKIADVQAFAVPRAVFAKVTASDGTVGWGECGHTGGPLTARLVNTHLRPLAIGQDVLLYVDANNGYSARRAIQVGRRLAGELGVALFEEPVAAYQYPALARVAAALDIPVAAGEHEYTRWQFRDLILQGQVDVLNPDLGKMGGLTDGMKVATLAEIFDLPIVVHNARPTLLTAAHLHYVAASRMARGPQEHPGSDRLADLWQYFDNRLDWGIPLTKVAPTSCGGAAGAFRTARA